MAAVLGVLLLVVPVLELYVVFRIGQWISFPLTGLLLVAEGVLGAVIIQREGRRAWSALRQALATGVLPRRELADAALVLAGGALLLTPGFLTDVAGFLLVLPATRPLCRRILARLLVSRMFAATRLGQALRRARGYGAAGGEGTVVRGEVVDRSGPTGTQP